MKKRVIIRFQGGLGNQFFIYAASLALQKRRGVKLVADTITGFSHDPYQRKFEAELFNYTPKDLCSRFFGFWFFQLIRVCRKLKLADNFLVKQITETNYTAILEGRSNPGLFNYLDGYFQYRDVPEISREQLYQKCTTYFRQYLENQPAAIRERFNQLSAGKYAIVHVRRQNYEQLDFSFYTGALQQKEYQGQPVCFISDDISWVQDELNRHQIEQEVRLSLLDDPLLELYLLVKADKAIISFSTFSWLGAWLSCIRKGSFTGISYPSYNSQVILSENFLFPEWKGIDYKKAVENTTL
jgi:hypothetical protein